MVLLEDYEVINNTEFYVVYPAGRNTSPRIHAFIDFFQKKLSSEKI
jgi:DNA-binding transcriptional LysR family regulator